MKNIFYILLSSCVLLFAAGCEDDNKYPDYLYPDMEQEFPWPDNVYIPGSADGLTTEPEQFMLSTDNARTFYVDGVNPGAETFANVNGQAITAILDGGAKTQATTNQWQLSNKGTASGEGVDDTATAVDVVVSVPEQIVFDYMMFVNRTFANGFIFKFEWFLSRKGNPDNYESQGVVQQVESLGTPTDPGITGDYGAYASKLSLPENYIGDVAKVKFRINFEDGRGTTCVIREVEFWKSGEVADIPVCFTDRSCSALKTGTSQADIDRIDSPLFKDLAQAIYNGYYEKYRVLEPLPRENPDAVAALNKSTLSYGNLHYPTGIWAQEGEKLVVLAEGVTGAAALTILGKDVPYASAVQNATLENGINIVQCNAAGTVYFSNFDPGQTSLKVNVINGRMGSYFNVEEHDYKTLEFIRSNVRNGENIDLIGRNTIFTASSADFLEYCKDPFELLGVYDKMVVFQQEFSGMTMNTAKLHFVETGSRPAMKFETYRGEFNPNYMSDMLDAETFRNSITEYARITAPVNIPAGFRWAGVNTSQANGYLFAAATAEHLGVPNLYQQDLSLHDAAYKHYFVDGNLHTGSTQQLYGKTNAVALWQLHLYFKHVKGIQDFYPRVISALREGTVNTPANFVKTVCEVSGYNLAGFFNKWGYNLAANFEDNSLSPEVAANIPSDAIEYISDMKVGLYKNPVPVSVSTSYYGLSEDNEYSFDFSACRNVAAYEVFIDGTLAYVSIQDRFSFTAVPGTTVTANAIAANRIVTPVTLVIN